MANYAAEEQLREEARRLLTPFGFGGNQKIEVWEAFQAHPDGIERCALQARAWAQRDGTGTGAGLLLTMIRRGDHQREPDPTAERPTGWRWVRGTDGQSGTYVQDPEGVDKLPPNYDLTTRGGTRDDREPYDVAPITDTTMAELRRLAGRR